MGFSSPALYRSIRYRLDRRQLAGENGDGADVRLRKGGEQVELPMSKPSARRACRLGRFGNHAHPRSVKAGRELAGWSRLKLAARVNVCDGTIRRYERGGRAAATLDLMMVRQILESAGVEFIAESGCGRA